MRQITVKDFSDFQDPQLVWEVYGEILDIYEEELFTAEQIANEIGINKKLVNKIIHRLTQHNALEYVHTDHWGVKNYRLNEEFIS
jgi:transcription initiation factor IIE alpha subunit